MLLYLDYFWQTLKLCPPEIGAIPYCQFKVLSRPQKEFALIVGKFTRQVSALGQQKLKPGTFPTSLKKHVLSSFMTDLLLMGFDRVIDSSLMRIGAEGGAGVVGTEELIRRYCRFHTARCAFKAAMPQVPYLAFAKMLEIPEEFFLQQLQRNQSQYSVENTYSIPREPENPNGFEVGSFYDEVTPAD